MKNILIIGGSSGIGLQLSKQLAASNNNVTATFNKTEVEDQINGVSFHHLDVFGNDLDFSFLPNVIDGFVYCPGSISLKPFGRIKPEDFQNDYNLNVIGAVKTLQAALPKLKNSEKPAIVFFSTVAVQLGLNFHSQVAASKGAIEGLTKALAAEMSPKIRVNCIAPSLTDTPLSAVLLSSDEKREANAQRHPLKKVGTASDLANIAAFLLSEKSSWITGQIIHVDGGMSTLKV
jgi:NAD(P)-dependent dehydrogenase (short-subunit alcohol dehydrogenase family)